MASVIAAPALPRLPAQTFGRKLKDGVPILVLLGGYPDDSSLWSRQIAEFESTHHIVSVCTPHFDHIDAQGRFTSPLPSSHRWGYTPLEVRDMILACIDNVLTNEEGGDAGADRRPPFDLVAHDWGAYWGYLVASERPGQVRRVVALDIGANVPSDSDKKQGDPQDEAPPGSLWALPYQTWFAVSFLVGVTVSTTLAQALYRSFFFLEPIIGPLGYGYSVRTSTPRPVGEQMWWMCWPYYQLWSGILRGTLPQPLFPSAPTLFVYGKKKRTMYHTDSFLNKLKMTKGCKAIAYDCCHWIQHEKASELNRDMRSFLD